ncbi:MAG: hypothetical protein IJ680_06280, partial [Paludibacteraceae bacterium]|nr:hypothetical protein [Paludibacteraceae bacterium]
MKKTRFGLLLLLSCTATLNMAAQTVSHKVEWKGLETWYADTTSVSVITADHAAYLRSDRLPSIVNIQPIGQLEPVVTIMNTQYEAVPENEARLIDPDVLGSEAFVETHVFITDEGNKLQTAVFPFALQDGRIMRLTNYQLQTSIPPKAKVIRATGTHTYADQSVLATGNFVKLRIDSTGLYRISYTTLRAAGIDPANVRVFGYGGAMLSQDFLQKKTDDLPEIAVYDDGSNIIFYAQGTTSWSYNSTTGLFEHTINPYATSGYYFVTSSDVGQKKRITNAAAIPTAEGTYSVSRFTDYSVYEREAVNLVDPSGLAGGGRQFMGDRMTSGTSITIPFHFDNVYTSQSVKAVMNVATSTQQTASFALAFAGNSRILNISKSTTMTDQAYTRSITSSFKAQKDIDEFRLTFTASEASTIGYLDYLEVNACRSLIMSGSNMPFRSIDNYGDSKPYLFSLSNAGSSVEVWEITEPTEMKRMQVTHSGETLSFAGLNGDTVHQYVAVDLTRINELPEPQVVGGIPNQNLHGLSGIDLVIITHPDFKAASDRLAQAHADMDGMTTAVVTSEEVY